jgi:hypothetical protein
VRELRPSYLPADPVSRTTYQPGEPAQCDLWTVNESRRNSVQPDGECFENVIESGVPTIVIERATGRG